MFVICFITSTLFPTAAVPPASAVKEFELSPALEISLFAAEPDVVDPVGLTFDEDGRIYVVEMRDYPLGMGPEHKPGGTIRLLEDRDGDGKIDHSALFAEGLSFPTSVTPWKGGIFVSAPPEIIFFKDTNGDGKADVREVMFRGFTKGVTDSNVNGLRWGLDNRIHGANGGNGGSVSSPRHPERTISLGHSDFSFNPATANFTTTFHTGGGFGLAFDDWGRSFTTYNIDHIQHRVMPSRYLNRFPGLPPVKVTQSISDHEEMSRIFPISVPETRVNHPEQAGHFSATGGMGYIGAPGYAGDLVSSILVCDVVGNLVHRDVLWEDGPSFIAKRSPSEQNREFIASRDNACRPVGLELGPDGALYLIDMQREVIEHPDYIPQKVKEKLNLRGGENRGRIFRVIPKGGLPPTSIKLGRASSKELVGELSSANQWRRVTAQRLLVERQDKAAVPPLKNLAINGQKPLGRLHALWTLHGLGALDESLVIKVLADQHPGIRENALIFSEDFQLSKSTLLPPKILALADDISSRVRFQAALTIGEFESPGAQSALLNILRRDYRFRWSRLAVLSSLRVGGSEIFRSLFTEADFRQTIDENKTALIRELADLIGARTGTSETNGVAIVLTTLAESNLSEPWVIGALEGLQAGLTRQSTPGTISSQISEAIQKIEAGKSSALLAASWKLCRTLGLPETENQRKALTLAIQNANEVSRPVAERVSAIRLLGLGNFPSIKSALFSLLEGTQPAAVQSTVIETLRTFNEPEIGQTLVAQWRALSPGVKTSVIQLLLQRRSFQESLLTAVEQGQIKVGELNLDLEQRRRLLWSGSTEVKARAAKFWSDEEYSNRKTIVTEWLAKLPATGDAQRGHEVFEKTCAQCHRLEDVGYAVGPDLSDAAHRSVEDLLSNILDPNMAINPAYAGYTVEWSPDEIATGILQSETPEAITLLQAQGIKAVISRAKLKRMESTGLSLMPEGLEAGLTPQQMRDLIAFLNKRR
ncbi:MAG: PVC-type heme-binding CxxCH protein [Verrucomicrobiota bacterium]